MGQILEASARLRPCATFNLTSQNGAIIGASLVHGGTRTNYKVGDRLRLWAAPAPPVRARGHRGGERHGARRQGAHARQLLEAAGESLFRSAARGGTPHELDVDLLSVSIRPGRSRASSREQDRFPGQPNRDDNNEPEPVVRPGSVSPGTTSPSADQLTPNLLVAGAEMNTRVRCGNHALGYSLFYGVWEFVYEKLVFWLT